MSERTQELTMVMVRTMAVAAAMLMVTILTIGRSQAAFTATSSNTGSSFSTGSVVLTDDDSDSALFTAADMTPGSPVVGCIEVTYSGTITPAPIRLYGSTTGTLATYLDTTIEVGSGGDFADCSGFSASSTIFSGTLAAFATASTNYSNGLAVATAASNPTVVTLRITVEVQNSSAAQGLSSTATFAFESQA